MIWGYRGDGSDGGDDTGKHSSRPPAWTERRENGGEESPTAMGIMITQSQFTVGSAVYHFPDNLSSPSRSAVAAVAGQPTGYGGYDLWLRES